MSNKEEYSEGWLSATIHINPVTMEIHSDGNHMVREIIENKFKEQEKVIENAAACFDCCNVYQKLCRTEEMRKILCEYYGKEYKPEFLPEGK